MDQNQIADILADARQYIEDHGWNRGALRNPSGHVCSLGGIVYSQGWNDHRNNLRANRVNDLHEVSLAVLAAIPAFTGIRTYDTAATKLASWNDAWADGEQEVLDAFAKAEKITRAGYDPDAA